MCTVGCGMKQGQGHNHIAQMHENTAAVLTVDCEKKLSDYV